MGNAGEEPIGDEELLYRRIPRQPSFYDAEKDPAVTPLAFKPTKNDTSGLSIFRAKYISIEKVAENDRDKKFFVAVLKAGDLRLHGLIVVPSPLPNSPGHAEISSLTYATRKTTLSKEMRVKLAHELCLRVGGPYPE